jgi:hypothetical protein
MPDTLILPPALSIDAILVGRSLLSGAAFERARRLEAESGESKARIFAASLGGTSRRREAK